MAYQDKNYNNTSNTSSNEAQTGNSTEKKENKFSKIYSKFPSKQIQAYVILAGGILLFLYSAFGFLKTFFDFTFAIVGMGLALYGAKESNLFEQLNKAWEYLRKKANF